VCKRVNFPKVDVNFLRSQLEGTHLFIATPCYGGQATTAYLQSVVSFSRLASVVPLDFDLATSANESLVTRARNRMVRLFLDSKATHLLFIDADIEFNPFDIFRMLLHDVPVVCGAYPMKGLFFDRLLDTSFSSEDEVRLASTKYASNLASDEDPLSGGFKLNVKNGLISVTETGTGFILIKRSVVQHIIDSMPDLAYESDDVYLPGEWYSLFDTGIVGRRYLSEDYHFCHLWRSLGGDVWLDPEIVLNHVGTYSFQGARQPYADMVAAASRFEESAD